MLPSSQVPVHEVKRLQVLHAGRDLRGHVQQRRQRRRRRRAQERAQITWTDI